MTTVSIRSDLILKYVFFNFITGMPLVLDKTGFRRLGQPRLKKISIVAQLAAFVVP